MSDKQQPLLSVAALFAERDAHQQHEREAAVQLKQKKDEELASYRKRLEAFQLTDAQRQKWIEEIKRAFEQGETELLLASFPRSFCTGSGRAITNFGEPPINKPDKAAPKPDGPRVASDIASRCPRCL